MIFSKLKEHLSSRIVASRVISGCDPPAWVLGCSGFGVEISGLNAMLDEGR